MWGGGSKVVEGEKGNRGWDRGDALNRGRREVTVEEKNGVEKVEEG